MAGRLLLELVIFSLPFLVFGLFLLATQSAEEAGKRKWPIQLLFLIGIGLATAREFRPDLNQRLEPGPFRRTRDYSNNFILRRA